MQNTITRANSQLDLLLTRASSATLSEPGPTRAQIEAILTAAVTAADHGRLRPWRFIVMEGDGRLRLGRLLAASQARAKPNQSPESLEKAQLKALRAPVVIAVVCKGNPDHKVPLVEQQLAVGAATAQLMLAAKALGFGSSWKTGSPAYDPLLIEGLGFSSADSVIGFIYIGTETEASPARRATIEGVVEYWGADQ